MKNESGITLIVLVITITLMLILSSITVYLGAENVEKSKVVNFVAYMQTIQEKVDFIAQYEDYWQYGEELSNTESSKLESILNSENENFQTAVDSIHLRFFDSSHIASDLEIENIDDKIVVDFYTREVISLVGVKHDGKMYYTQYNLPGGQTLKQHTEETTRTVGFENIVPTINGLNATFTINNIGITNGTLYYGITDSNNVIKWTVITDYTKKGENITTKNITESGTYYFKLVDNTNGNDNKQSGGTYPELELRLTNMPKLEDKLTDLSTSYNYSNLNKSEEWAFATDKTFATNVQYYVWIPRFAYKLNASGTLQELQFLRGTSDITTSAGYINNTEWTVPDKFTNNGIQKTGVWVKVTSPKQTRNRYN